MDFGYSPRATAPLAVATGTTPHSASALPELVAETSIHVAWAVSSSATRSTRIANPSCSSAAWTSTMRALEGGATKPTAAGGTDTGPVTSITAASAPYAAATRRRASAPVTTAHRPRAQSEAAAGSTGYA